MLTPKKRTTLAIAGSALLFTGVISPPGSAAAHSSSDGRHGGKVLEGTWQSDRLEEAFLDHDANGAASLGDEIVYTSAGTGGLGDGTDHGRCTFHLVDHAADSATVHCTATSYGARGSFSVQGVTRVGLSAPVLREPSSWAVTGGTGEFASASGEIHIEAFEGSGLDFRTSGTYRIVLDD